MRLDPDVEKARPSDFRLIHVGIVRQRHRKFSRNLARIGEMRFRLFRIDHRRIDREIAMRGIARRFDDKTREIEIGRQTAIGDDVLQQRRNAAVEIGINVHGFALRLVAP